jgi:hypothetical protein
VKAIGKADYFERFAKVKVTAKWAITMTQVAIRRATREKPYPRWHFIKFVGEGKSESRGVVDLVAIRKDHGEPKAGLKRGDSLQLVLIQVKGGAAAKPTPEDASRIRIVARRHGACGILLATWKKGNEAQFFTLHPKLPRWDELEDLLDIFG